MIHSVLVSFYQLNANLDIKIKEIISVEELSLSVWYVVISVGHFLNYY